MSCGTGYFSKVTFQSFEIDKILFVAFRVKLHLKKTSSELICDIDEFKLKISCPSSILLHGRHTLPGNVSSSWLEKMKHPNLC